MQGIRVGSISMHKTMLRIHPYFHVLASSLRSLNFKLASCTKAIKSCNTMIIVIQIKVQPSINSIHLLRYDSHMTSGYSYLRVAKIRIGVHLAGET
jgi:hypothetical protein